MKSEGYSCALCGSTKVRQNDRCTQCHARAFSSCRSQSNDRRPVTDFFDRTSGYRLTWAEDSGYFGGDG